MTANFEASKKKQEELKIADLKKAKEEQQIAYKKKVALMTANFEASKLKKEQEKALLD